MRHGDLLLLDEISLADDAVLERLNSVLDPARSIVLPEKGRELEEVVAAPGFRLLATMNPGGDFGKKELSPALRNRFTEVWVPAVGSRDELLQLLRTKLHGAGAVGGGGGGGGGANRGAEGHGGAVGWDAPDAMLSCVEWLAAPEAPGAAAAAAGGGGMGGMTASLRDLTAWVDFQNSTARALGPYAAFVHGACLVFIDAIGLSVASSRAVREARRTRCIERLLQLLPPPVAAEGARALHLGTDTVPEMAEGERPQPYAARPVHAHDSGAHDLAGAEAMDTSTGGVARAQLFGLPPFFIDLGSAPSDAAFSLHAPTTRANAFRVLRALQLRKPILLEGSPGVGKTSLVQALGAACGHTVVRINLSEQSDLMELLGTDLPVEGAPAGTYAWQDGAFLAALKAGHWVILDELNLAPQSVLEGLNSCLDHRASVYIPELGATYACPSTFRVFGCQNPLQQGGGRKGLPKSFLNRFTQVIARRDCQRDCPNPFSIASRRCARRGDARAARACTHAHTCPIPHTHTAHPPPPTSRGELPDRRRDQCMFMHAL
jgi:midasin